MKVLAVNSSPRHNGNTMKMLQTVLDICGQAGMQTEIFQAGSRPVLGCRACGGCSEHIGRCAIDDWINVLYDKMLQADAILLGSPTYFSDVTPEMKAIIDRCGFVARHADNPLRHKVGAAVSAVRRAGGTHTLDSMQHFFLISEMIIPGSIYWNTGVSRLPGDFENDKDGVSTMIRLGENIVWLLSKLAK